MSIKSWVKSKPVIHEIVSSIISPSTKKKAMLGRITLTISPKLHNAIMQRYSMPKKVRINIHNPQLFNEKIVWLKYYIYNRSPLVALCYDKYTVREYIKAVGLEHILIPLLGVWDKIEDIDWKIQENCVYKPTNNSAGCVFHFLGNKYNREEDEERLRNADLRRKRFWISGDKFACVNTNRYICERFISESIDEYPYDYKFYCFHGEPMYVLCCMNRKKKTQVAFLDMNWNLRRDLRIDSIDTPPKRPDNFDKMIECAKILSRCFPFVRVDLYNEGGRIYFGELTFTPSMTYSLLRCHGEYGMKEMGKLIDLKRAEIIQIPKLKTLE